MRSLPADLRHVLRAPLWFGAGGLLKTPLFGVAGRDPAVGAGFFPAWRASRVDPNSAIRIE